MRFPWVSRRAYDDVSAALHRESAKYDTLLERYHALRVAGQVPTGARPLPPTKPPEPDPEQRAIDAAGAAFLATAEAAFLRDGKSPREARELAEQIRATVTEFDGVPSFVG